MCIRDRAIKDKNGRTVNLVKMRNPWGSVEWKGNWRDDDDENWTPKLRDELKVTIKDDGEFWMDVRDFSKYFNLTGVCSPNAKEGDSTTQAIDVTDGREIVAFNLDKEVNCSENPLFFTCPQQGPFLSYYRDTTQYNGFTLNFYLMALFDDKGR